PGYCYRMLRTSSVTIRYERNVSLFFFSSRRRHTRCYRDWSSDVCSSDLEHPPWAVRAVRAVECDVDFGRLYGREWSFLNERPPRSEERRVGKEWTSRRRASHEKRHAPAERDGTG